MVIAPAAQCSVTVPYNSLNGVWGRTVRLGGINSIIEVLHTFNLRMTRIRLQSHDFLLEFLIDEDLPGAHDGPVDEGAV